MALLKFNHNAAKNFLSGSQIKNAVKGSNKKEQLLQKAFDIIGRVQPRLGYDTITIKADVSADPKGETQLTVQMGNYGTDNHKMYEIAYSKKMKVFSFDEEKPNLV